MIKETSGVWIASFTHLNEVNLEEVSRADIIHFREKIDFGIYHPSKLMWKCDLSNISDPLEIVRSSKDRAAFEVARDFFASKGFCLKTVPLTHENQIEFKLLYDKTTGAKDRALHYSFSGNVGSRQAYGDKLYISGLFNDESKLVSGLLFGCLNNEARVLFGAKERYKEVRGGTGGVCEHEFTAFCLKKGVTDITRGNAFNPYGVFTSPGLFEFKTRYGSSAFPSEYWHTTFVKNISVIPDDLVLVTTNEGRPCYAIYTDRTIQETVNKYKSREVDQVIVYPKSILTEQYLELEKYMQNSI